MSGLGSSPRPVDDARGLFVEAAQATLANADPGSGAWRTLLARLDNDAEMTAFKQAMTEVMEEGQR